MLTIKCPTCQNELSCDDSCRGSVVECGICQSEIEIMQNGMPRPAGAAPASAPTPGMRPASSFTPTPGKSPAAAPAPGPVPVPVSAAAPAPVPSSPYSGSSRKSSSGSGAAGAIFLAWIAILLAIGSAVFFWFRTDCIADFSYSNDPEVTAKNMFKQYLKQSGLNNSQKAYVLSNCKKEALDNFKARVEDRREYVLILWETKVKSQKWYGHYWLKENKNGVFVYASSPKYGNDYEKWSDSDKEWLEKMEEKIKEHERDNKDLDWDIKIK